MGALDLIAESLASPESPNDKHVPSFRRRKVGTPRHLHASRSPRPGSRPPPEQRSPRLRLGFSSGGFQARSTYPAAAATTRAPAIAPGSPVAVLLLREDVLDRDAAVLRAPLAVGVVFEVHHDHLWSARIIRGSAASISPPPGSCCCILVPHRQSLDDGSIGFEEASSPRRRGPPETILRFLAILRAAPASGIFFLVWPSHRSKHASTSWSTRDRDGRNLLAIKKCRQAPQRKAGHKGL